jgi:paraquat-inducible protein B
MPTIPSSMQEFTETMESLSIQEMVNDAHQVLAGLKALVNSPELTEILTGINQFVNSGELLGVVRHADDAIGDVQALVSNIDGQVGNLSNRAEYTLAEVDKTLDSAQKTLDAARQSLSIAAEGSPMRYELEQMLGELTAAARSIRLLAEYIERNPDALLRGKPGGS